MTDDNFKRLQEKWYKKLEKEGFKDIEKEGYLKDFEQTRGGNSDPFPTCPSEDKPRQWQDQTHSKGWLNRVSNHAKILYYELAGEFLYNHKFQSKLERRIWKLHSQGVSMRSIKKQVSLPHRIVGLRTVFQTIRKLRKIMLNLPSEV